MNYSVSAVSSPFGETVDVKHKKDPESAILEWFRFSKKYPTCTSIQPETKEDGTALLKWANLNSDKLETWAKEYKCPYKFEWLKEQIETQVKNHKCSMQWEFDELFPFCMG